MDTVQNHRHTLQRQTVQRDLVYKAVCRHYDHPSAEILYEELVAEMPTLSRATVYRNLNVLADNGKIRRVRIPNSPDRFDPTLEDHYHIHCSQCGAVSDIHVALDETSRRLLMDGDAGEYEVHGYEIVFNTM